MTNEAGWDRVARVVLGVVLMIVGFGVIGGTAGIVIGIIGVVPLLTGAIGWCPIYSLINFRTNSEGSDATS